MADLRSRSATRSGEVYLLENAHLESGLGVVNAPALATELKDARDIRLDFLPEGWPEPYLNAVVRTFRLAKGAKSYLEVSTRDKGHIAWVSTLLAPDSTVADVDIVNFPDNETRLLERMNPSQKLVRIVAEPSARSTPAQIAAQLTDFKFDLVFANFASYYNDALAEVSLYYPLVVPGGFLIINDAYWEGDGQRKGKCQALALLACKRPIYCVHMDEPLHLFTPREQVGGAWGTLAIIRRP